MQKQNWVQAQLPEPQPGPERVPELEQQFAPRLGFVRSEPTLLVLDLRLARFG